MTKLFHRPCAMTGTGPTVTSTLLAPAPPRASERRCPSRRETSRSMSRNHHPKCRETESIALDRGGRRDRDRCHGEPRRHGLCRRQPPFRAGARRPLAPPSTRRSSRAAAPPCPFVEQEAETAATNGTVIGPSTTAYTLPAEASGRSAVSLAPGPVRRLHAAEGGQRDHGALQHPGRTDRRRDHRAARRQRSTAITRRP